MDALRGEDFRRIAEIIGKHAGGMTDDCLLEMTSEFADWLMVKYPGFDRARFKAAVAAASASRRW